MTGPGCPSCEHNDENPILAWIIAEPDTPRANEIVGYEMRCRQCGIEWDEFLYHEYGIVR